MAALADMNLVPNNIIIGGGSSDGEGLGLLNKYLGVSLIEKLSGKSISSDPDVQQKGSEKKD
ncbi:MAG: hypothetical protein R3B65_02490 [Candidatus Paceibacterota bacterium]